MLYVRGKADFYASTERALEEIDPTWRELPGVIIFGTHAFEEVGRKLEMIRHARENGVPFFGECGGLQLAVIEYARNVWKEDADTTELNPATPCPVVTALPALRVGIHRVEDRWESFWHRYSVNGDHLIRLSKDWEIVVSDGLAARMRLLNHPFFVGTQYHPSYNSSKDSPHPILVDFLKACKRHASDL